jgi:hypothetical protein
LTSSDDELVFDDVDFAVATTMTPVDLVKDGCENIQPFDKILGKLKTELDTKIARVAKSGSAAEKIRVSDLEKKVKQQDLKLKPRKTFDLFLKDMKSSFTDGPKALFKNVTLTADEKTTADAGNIFILTIRNLSPLGNFC